MNKNQLTKSIDDGIIHPECLKACSIAHDTGKAQILTAANITCHFNDLLL